MLIARDRDLPALQRLGRVDRLATGASVRFDRAFELFRVVPDSTRVAQLVFGPNNVRR